MNEIKVLELFGGIGAIRKAFERQNIPHKVVDYVEIDKYAVASYNAIFNEHFEPQNICEWDKDIEVDFIMHGSPCQDFSVAGNNQGGNEGSGTRSSLMWETIRIVKKLKPKYILWENVKNVISKKHKHNFDKYIDTLNELGYKSYYQVLNAKNYGVPQNRERVFTLSIRNDVDGVFLFPQKEELKIKLKDMLEDDVDEKYYLSEKMINYLCSRMPSGSHHITTGINISNKNEEDKLAGTICTEPGNKPSDNYIIDNDNIIYSKKEGGLLIKNNTKKGYLLAKDGDGVYTEPSATKRGMVQDGITPTITQRQNVGVVVNDKNKLNEIINSLRLRKLTPKECFRLMGFDDEDYNKASQVNSNTQLYKQAGNSIVVNILEKILSQLFKNEMK